VIEGGNRPRKRNNNKKKPTMSKLVASVAAEEYARVRESPLPRVHGRPAWKDYLKLKKHAVGVSLGSDVG